MVRFAAVSGVGWLLDFCIFAMLVHQGLAPGPSNAIGAGAAVVWVFFSSVRHIFRYRGASLHSRFVGYVIYQVLMIAMASLGVATLVRFAGIDALLAKALVTPLTFLANFLFMAWLTGPESRST
jgi:putative flippase GtrA